MSKTKSEWVNRRLLKLVNLRKSNFVFKSNENKEIKVIKLKNKLLLLYREYNKVRNYYHFTLYCSQHQFTVILKVFLITFKV